MSDDEGHSDDGDDDDANADGMLVRMFVEKSLGGNLSPAEHDCSAAHRCPACSALQTQRALQSLSFSAYETWMHAGCSSTDQPCSACLLPWAQAKTDTDHSLCAATGGADRGGEGEEEGRGAAGEAARKVAAGAGRQRHGGGGGRHEVRLAAPRPQRRPRRGPGAWTCHPQSCPRRDRFPASRPRCGGHGGRHEVGANSVPSAALASTW